MSRPLILYIPGLLPKPRKTLHRDALRRCLLAGLQRIDPVVARSVENAPNDFDIVAWTYDFYGEHRDLSLDAAAIDAVVVQEQASDKDIAEATSWRRRLTRWIYCLGDMLPFLIPHLANERMEVHLRDLMRYERNKNGIAERVREQLKVPLVAAAGAERPILLIGHSMGSIIAYDTLWELTHEHANPVTIDTFLSMGSPLGQRFMQNRISGHDSSGAKRYPGNVRHWQNLSAVGDLTAIDPDLKKDFSEMIELGLLQNFKDDTLFNYFRLNGVLNVHSEYGYLCNTTTARCVAAWWRGHMPGLEDVSEVESA